MKIFFRNIHFYLSLGAGIIIFCSCLTGTILVFKEEIEHALHYNRYYAQPNGQRLPIAQLIFDAVKTVPKAKLSNVKVYTDANRTVEIGLTVPEKKGSKGKEEKTPLSQENEQQKSDQPKQGNRNKPEKKDAEMKGKKPEEGGDKPNLTVFVNPYTGKIIEQFNRRKTFFFTIEMFHRFLLAGKNSIGNKIVSFSTPFFLFILVTGVVLWWPKNKKIMK